MKHLFLALLLLATACETQRYVPAAIDAKVDSTLRAAGIGPLQAGKIKIAGNVILNTGPGAVQVADNRKANSKSDHAFIGDGNVPADASTKNEESGTASFWGGVGSSLLWVLLALAISAAFYFFGPSLLKKYY